MNEVFDTLANVFEELRSESEDREYSVLTMMSIENKHNVYKKSKILYIME